MAREQDGTYNLPLPAVNSGELIESVWANTSFNDFAATFQDSLSRAGNGGMQAALKIVDGTFDAPGIAFGSEADTGIYRPAAGDFYISVLGVPYLRITNENGVQVSADGGTTWNDVTGGDYADLEARVTVLEADVTALETDVTALQALTQNMLDGTQVFTELVAQEIEVFDNLSFFNYTPNWASGTQTLFIDSSNRQYVSVTANLTINISYSPYTDRLGGNYVLESVILFHNVNGSTITLNVPAAEVMGAPNTVAGSRSILTCMVFYEGNVELNRVFVWSAENP
mgnify:CR=1 FL=1